MRKFHRWISVFFGVFLLWIAVTGTISQILPLVAGGDGDRPKAAQTESKTAESKAAEAKPAFTCPPGYSCRPKPKPGDPRALIGFFHHLHSGETFGPIGIAISLLSGIAMIFFSFSGLWMYIQMWRNRSARGVKPGWFWN